MGFCKFCGEISQGKCAKCGGRAVESIISCMVSDGDRVSVVDRWQSRYEGTILSPEELVKKSPTAKRVPVTQSTFYDPKKKLCTCCSKVLEFKYSIHMQDGMLYCKACHLKLFNKGTCPTCLKYVTDKQDFIEYSNKVWHKDCFVCFNCHTALEENPLVDLEDRPCCESCFMSQAGKKRANTSKLSSKPITTRTLSKNSSNFDTVSSLGSNDSIRSSHSNSSASTASSSVSSAASSYGYSRRPRLDRTFYTSTSSTPSPSSAIPPPLTRTPSPKDEDEQETDELPDLLSKRPSLISYQKRLSSVFTPPVASNSTPAKRNTIHGTIAHSSDNTDTTDSAKSPTLSSSPSPSISNQPFNKPFSSSSTSIAGSLSKRPCHNCHQPLGDSSQRKVKVPLDNNEYAWFHKACFVCKKCSLPFRNNECVTDGHYYYHLRCDENNQKTSVCQGCHKSITQDAFQFNGKTYHFQCFKCHYCASHISLGQPLFEIDGKPYCQFCSSNPRVLDSANDEEKKQPILQQPAVNNSDSGSNDSYLGSRRMSMPLGQQKRYIPKIGGSKICPRCQQAISILEDTPGPLATRWHKKCLCCFKCSKQLDSAARMRPGKNTSEFVVYCRNCSI